jgi:DNA-binding GntR family transcriptional regulator
MVEALKKKDSVQVDRLSQKHLDNVLKNILAHKDKGEYEDTNA